jgi:hypothetical protein
MTTDDQQGLWDEEVDDEALEDALVTINGFNMQLAIFKERYATKNVAAARKLVKETVEAYARQHELHGGERLRVGRFVVHTTPRSGGGFEVPRWSKVLMGSFELLEPAPEA